MVDATTEPQREIYFAGEKITSEGIDSLINSSSSAYQSHVLRKRKRSQRKRNGTKTSTKHGELGKNDADRFNRTMAALRSAGLMEIISQTSKLLDENRVLQKKIDQLEQETSSFRRTLPKDQLETAKETEDQPESAETLFTMT